MKSKSVVGVRLAVGLAASGALASLAGCYASEKIGKDIRDVSHDVNQGGIYMHRGALSVYRPERHPDPALTNASITAPATAPTSAPAAADAPAPMATPEWQPPADGSEELPKKEATPPAAPPAPAPDGGVYSM